MIIYLRIYDISYTSIRLNISYWSFLFLYRVNKSRVSIDLNITNIIALIINKFKNIYSQHNLTLFKLWLKNMD